MLSLSSIVDLLKPKPDDFSGLWFRKIGGGGEYAKAMTEKLPLPLAWVIRAADTSTSIGDGATDDVVAFDVVIAIENQRTQNPFEADEQMIRYRQAVLDLLLGYALPGSIKPVTFEGGQVLDYANGELFWRDRYRVVQTITTFLPDPVVGQSQTFRLDKS
jgi:hypothetical protein